MRKWREEKPIKSAWAVHRWNAKRRGISVLWDFIEFALFCSFTGYHITKGETTIDRINCLEGYSLENCTCIDFDLNSFKGRVVEKEIHKRHREKYGLLKGPGNI